MQLSLLRGSLIEISNEKQIKIKNHLNIYLLFIAIS